MGNIFEELKKLNVCYAVCVGFVTLKGVTQNSTKDYFIASPCDNRLKKIGFRISVKTRDIMEYSMDTSEILAFKSISFKYRLALSCDDGRVYELPKWSLKQVIGVLREERKQKSELDKT